MQDRYAGDIGDFGKYGLLRALCGDDLRLGVLWYTFEGDDEESPADGRHVDYLRRADAGLRGCDADLFNRLRDVVVVRGDRSIAAIEDSGVLPSNTCTHREKLTFEEEESRGERRQKRDRWVSTGMDAVEAADVVFVDPDNGLPIGSVDPLDDAGPKYAYYEDLIPHWRGGQSIVIYQHASRSGSAAEQVARRVEELRRHFDGAPGLQVLRWRRLSARYYFILPAAHHAERLEARVRAFTNSPWGQRQPGYSTPHFELVEAPVRAEAPKRDTTSDLLAFALSLADAADAVSMRYYRTDHAAERKVDGSFVTPGDLEIEALLRRRIAEAYPDHAVLGEEAGDAGGADAEARWIVDPIDGTHNFMRGVPVWATLIAVERAGAVEVGVVSAPALGTRWWAGRGLGAYRGATGGRTGAGERIRVSDLETLSDSQIFVGDLVSTLDRWPGARALLGDVWRVRAPGDFWGFCLVAEGAADVMLEGVDLAPWDIAALIPIVEEAGGRLTDGEDGPARGAGPRVASNGRLHDEVVRRLVRVDTT